VGAVEILRMTGKPMETIDTARGDLNLLRPWREPVTPGRFWTDVLGSGAFHVALIVILVHLPEGPPPRPRQLSVDVRKATPLYLPRELTQKDPNKGQVSRSLDVRSALPPAPVPLRQFRPPAPAGPGNPAPPSPAPSVEPPKIEIAQQPLPVGTVTALPPPPEKTRLAFENVAPPPPVTAPPKNPQVPLPKTSVQELARSTTTRSGGGGGVFVEDTGTGPAQLREYELLSDPLGVDFKPYLIQVLASVRRNWMAVIPESGRMGRRGLVQVQFSIDRAGRVPKLVIATPSGTEAFDRAAVAGVSASNPFPPLPSDFKGDQIRLQLSFAYNIPNR
jgi:TonB family protein